MKISPLSFKGTWYVPYSARTTDRQKDNFDAALTHIWGTESRSVKAGEVCPKNGLFPDDKFPENGTLVSVSDDLQAQHAFEAEHVPALKVSPDPQVFFCRPTH